MPLANTRIPQKHITLLRSLLSDKVMTRNAAGRMITANPDLIKQVADSPFDRLYSDEFAGKFTAAMTDIQDWINRNGYSDGLESYVKNSYNKYGTARPRGKRRTMHKKPSHAFKYRVVAGSLPPVPHKVKQVVKQQPKQNYAQPTLHTTDPVPSASMDWHTKALKENTDSTNRASFSYAIASIVIGILLIALLVVSFSSLVIFLSKY